MAQTSSFIHPSTPIVTFDHPAGPGRAAGVLFDDVTIQFVGEGDIYDDAGRVMSCDRLIEAVTAVRDAALDRIEQASRKAVPA